MSPLDMTFRDNLFSIVCDREVRPVDTSAGRCFVRSLTVGEKDAFDVASSGGSKDPRVHLLIACVCDEAGEPVFTEFDAGRLRTLPSRLVEPLVKSAMAVNAFDQGDVETIEKNS